MVPGDGNGRGAHAKRPQHVLPQSTAAVDGHSGHEVFKSELFSEIGNAYETNYCPRCQADGKLLADRSLSRLLKNDWPKTIDELEQLSD